MGPAQSSLPNIALNIRSNCCIVEDDDDDYVDGKAVVQSERTGWLQQRFKTRKGSKNNKETNSTMVGETAGIQSEQTDEKTVSNT